MNFSPNTFWTAVSTVDWSELWDLFHIKFLLGSAVIVFRSNFSLWYKNTCFTHPCQSSHHHPPLARSQGWTFNIRQGRGGGGTNIQASRKTHTHIYIGTYRLQWKLWQLWPHCSTAVVFHCVAILLGLRTLRYLLLTEMFALFRQIRRQHIYQKTAGSLFSSPAKLFRGWRCCAISLFRLQKYILQNTNFFGGVCYFIYRVVE